MPIYITLAKYTGEGVKAVKDTKKYNQQGVEKVEKLGAKILGQYATMGEYDAVFIAEFPSDEAAVAASLTVSSDGYIRTTTMRAFTMEEFGKIIGKLP
jgi:uncharacterized protein with GYD domain